ncbi:zinc-binding dehydrogenase [Halalkalibacter krulwichiae]|uniref:zinc-binding dehydrogenase n=1 Tax=Halalkalibacter krulwichiae TaxID=199441 RepID=UPI000825A3CE|nr:zinc-binding dehydrogenase [Halalkalibacter krulwichiae]
MKAVVHKGKIGFDGLKYREITLDAPKKGEVKVKVKTAGLNHRDLFVLNRHQPNEPALVIGSDGAGIVIEVGEEVIDVNIGDEVIINPGLGWKENSDAPPSGFEIVGYPDNGTFAEEIIVSAENLLPKPSFLTWDEAGVLSLAALTAYRALFTRAKIQPGMKVLIPGIGSGVATFLLQFAKAVEATVYVTSRSRKKCENAIKLGADQAIDTNSDWEKELNGEKMDLVIECVGAATFNKSLERVRPGGTIVTFGASAGDDVEINIRQFFYGQYNLLGTTMGSTEEFREMLEFIQTYQIKPVIDEMFPLEQFDQAFKRLAEAKQLGKIGFRIY